MRWLRLPSYKLYATGVLVVVVALNLMVMWSLENNDSILYRLTEKDFSARSFPIN